MDFSAQLLFLFSAVGAFNGLILGLYFMFLAQPRDLTHRFLGMLILMLSLRVGKSVFFYFNPDLAFDYLQFGLTACFFIGPFLYFYVKRLAKPKSNIEQEWKYHLAVLIPIAIIVGYFYSFEEHVELWQNFVVRGIYNVWIFYIFLSLYTVREVFKKLTDTSQDLDLLDFWLSSLILCNLLLVSMYYTLDFTYYISGALSFSFLLYVSWAFIYFNKENRILYLSDDKKYGDKKIEEGEAGQLAKSLKALMEQEKMFIESNLNLPLVAKKVKTSPHRLSKYLNDNLNKSFTQYINEYRIEEAKKLILQKGHLTLEAIGYEVGFNSRSTFYSSFKKYTGQTPSAYKKTNCL